MDKSGKLIRAIIMIGWWSMALIPCQVRPAFTAIVRSKYRYGLMFLDESSKMKEADEGWTYVARTALLQMKTENSVTARSKRNALLEWEYIKSVA